MSGPARVFWFVAFSKELPEAITDGILWSEEVGDEAQVPADALGYAVLCRAAAESELSARARVAEWFADSGVTQPPTLTSLDSSKGRVTRKEKAIADGMRPGEVLVRSVFIAYPHAEAEGRRQAQALIEEVVSKKWWEFWR